MLKINLLVKYLNGVTFVCAQKFPLNSSFRAREVENFPNFKNFLARSSKNSVKNVFSRLFSFFFYGWGFPPSSDPSLVRVLNLSSRYTDF